MSTLGPSDSIISFDYKGTSIISSTLQMSTLLHLKLFPVFFHKISNFQHLSFSLSLCMCPTLKSRTTSWLSTQILFGKVTFLLFSVITNDWQRICREKETTSHLFSCHLFTKLNRIYTVILQQLIKQTLFSTVLLTRNDCYNFLHVLFSVEIWEAVGTKSRYIHKSIELK